MELIDEEGRLFGRVNVVDALVVLVVLAVVAAGVALVIGKPTVFGDDSDGNRYATLALGQHPDSSSSAVRPGQNVTLNESSVPVNVTDIYLTSTPDGQVQVLGRIAYPSGAVIEDAPLRVGRAVSVVSDDYKTVAEVRSVGDGRSKFRTRQTPVSVTTTVDASTAPAVDAGDSLTVGNQTLATIESVTSQPANESGVRHLRLGVTLATRTVGKESEFADRPLRIGASIPLRTNSVEGLDGTIETIGSLDPPGEPVNVTMTVTWEDTRPEVADIITEGLEERHRGATTRVVNVTSGPAQVVVPTDAGKLVIRDHPRNHDVTLIVDATARQRGSELRFHGRPLSEGRTVRLEFDTVTLRGTVLDFETNG